MSIIRSVNPTTGEVLEEFAADGPDQIEQKLSLAIEGFRALSSTPVSVRAKFLKKTADILEAERVPLGEAMTREMGKPIRAAVQEIEKCALACRYYASEGPGFIEPQPVQVPDGQARIEFQPLGPVLAIMPWNFPFWQVFRFAAPALLAGNAGLLKHASNVPRCASLIVDVLQRAGFPSGAFQAMMLSGAAAEKLIADERIVAVTLTGSVEAGRKVAAAAGKALKKTVLELGGSDPFIVMPSADLDKAADMAAQSRCINSGQSCIAAKRFIVHRTVKAQFSRLFVERMSGLKVGDPTLEETDVGPLATQDVLKELEQQVKQTVSKGARVLLGAQRLNRPGFFYAPSVLDAIPAGSPAHQQELFGPVASLFTAENMQDAMCLANDTRFGLGASLWSNVAEEHEVFAQGIQSGLAVINGMVVSDPRLPFGGVRESGYGRELGVFGIREFVNIKTVITRGASKPGSTPPAAGD